MYRVKLFVEKKLVVCILSPILVRSLLARTYSFKNLLRLTTGVISFINIFVLLLEWKSAEVQLVVCLLTEPHIAGPNPSWSPFGFIKPSPPLLGMMVKTDPADDGPRLSNRITPYAIQFVCQFCSFEHLTETISWDEGCRRAAEY